MPRVRLADSIEAIRRCYPVVAQLRPHLDEAAFLRRVRLQAAEGYRLAYIEAGGRVAAVAGYRVQHMLHQGKMLYVDDLITDDRRRSRGLGGALLDWLAAEARRQGCDALELDSGVQRVGAHRFYLMKGMHIDSYHFRLPLRSERPRSLVFPASRPGPAVDRPAPGRGRARAGATLRPRRSRRP